MAKVEYRAGELFPRLGFIVTNLEMPRRAVVRFYNKRGTADTNRDGGNNGHRSWGQKRNSGYYGFHPD